MTGFGRGAASVANGRVAVEVRSVNHKYQDVRISIAPDLAGAESDVEQRLRARFARGRVECSLRTEGSVGGGLQLDRDLARSCLSALDELRQEMSIEAPLTLDVLGSVPQLFQPTEAEDGGDALRAAALTALDEALDAAATMRRAEGAALARDLDGRLDRIDEILGPMEELASQVAPAALERLRSRLDRLLDGQHHKMDEGRLAQEVAILADRADVSEELTRLASHVAQFRSIAAETGPVGRRLEFLLQEMGRESSTIGAKAQDASLQHMVVDLRAEIARMREQIHNVE